MYPTAYEQSREYVSGRIFAEVAVEFLQNGTPCSQSWSPGAKAIPDTIAPINNISAYIKREDVEFRHDGHAEQHNEQAVPVQQQANYTRIADKKKIPQNRRKKNKFIL